MKKKHIRDAVIAVATFGLILVVMTSQPFDNLMGWLGPRVGWFGVGVLNSIYAAFGGVGFAVVCGSLLLSPFAAMIFFAGRRRLRERRQIAGHCDACGYSLKGLTSERCPECGEAISRATARRGEG